MSPPNAVPEITVSSGRPSGSGEGLGVLDGTVELVLLPRKRLNRLGLDEWVLGVMLGVEDREVGNDCDGVPYASSPPGNTTL